MAPAAARPVDLNVAATSAAAADTTASGGARHGVARFVVRRVASGLLTLLVATILIFAATDLLPGSPAAAVLGKFSTPAEIQALDKRLGYDRPVVVRYLDWLGAAVQGNLGNSSVGLAQGAQSAPVWPLIRSRLWNTLTLALIATVLLIPLSLLLGSLAALRAGGALDHLISTTTLAFISLPEFVIGTVLVLVFFVGLGWLPPISFIPPGSPAIAHPSELVMPVLTLLATTLAWTTRLVRAGMVDVLGSDYVQMARLSGLPERRVIRRYALRNALAPSVQVFGIAIQALFGGVIVVEVVFSYPGLGKGLVDAVNIHDNTLIQAIALLIAAFYISVNVVADLVVALLVPKIRTSL